MRIQPRSWTFRKIDSAEAKRPGCRIFLIHADAAPARLQEAVVEIAVPAAPSTRYRSEEHTSELQSLTNLVCRLLLEKKKKPSKKHKKIKQPMIKHARRK